MPFGMRTVTVVEKEQGTDQEGPGGLLPWAGWWLWRWEWWWYNTDVCILLNVCYMWRKKMCAKQNNLWAKPLLVNSSVTSTKIIFTLELSEWSPACHFTMHLFRYLYRVWLEKYLSACTQALKRMRYLNKWSSIHTCIRHILDLSPLIIPSELRKGMLK
jgi:hypothetical protein